MHVGNISFVHPQEWTKCNPPEVVRLGPSSILPLLRADMSSTPETSEALHFIYPALNITVLKVVSLLIMRCVG